MSIERELERLGQEIKKAESDLSRLEGSIETLRARLKDEFGLETDEDVEKELDRLAEQIGKHEMNIETGLRKLKELYEW
jgi:archaellum component FlaC